MSLAEEKVIGEAEIAEKTPVNLPGYLSVNMNGKISGHYTSVIRFMMSIRPVCEGEITQ